MCQVDLWNYWRSSDVKIYNFRSIEEVFMKFKKCFWSLKCWVGQMGSDPFFLHGQLYVGCSRVSIENELLVFPKDEGNKDVILVLLVGFTACQQRLTCQVLFFFFFLQWDGSKWQLLFNDYLFASSYMVSHIPNTNNLLPDLFDW